jgi:hypothetical protein
MDDRTLSARTLIVCDVCSKTIQLVCTLSRYVRVLFESFTTWCVMWTQGGWRSLHKRYEVWENLIVPEILVPATRAVSHRSGGDIDPEDYNPSTQRLCKSLVSLRPTKQLEDSHSSVLWVSHRTSAVMPCMTWEELVIPWLISHDSLFMVDVKIVQSLYSMRSFALVGESWTHHGPRGISASSLTEILVKLFVLPVFELQVPT